MKKRTLALALALGCVFMSPTLSYGEENAEVVSEIEEDSSTDEGCLLYTSDAADD